MASENNCFALYYEEEGLRHAKAYCAENNVCPNLFWNKVATGAEASVKTLSSETGSSDDSANRLSPVLCDFAASQKLRFSRTMVAPMTHAKLFAASHIQKKSAI